MPDEAADTGYAPERWDFDGEVTRVFDDMLARSVPQYEVMRRAVFDLGSLFVRSKTAVVDLGCSRGEAMAPFVDRFGARCSFVGVERSAPMLEAARARFAGWIATGVVSVKDQDLREAYPLVRASLTLAVLTLQFVPLNYRSRILRQAFLNTVPGGALILVEKVLGSDAETDRVLVRQYHELKAAAGYTREEIDRKRLALEGVLVPVTAEWNEQLLRAAGFQHIECFWRFLNFAGWLAVRPGGDPE